MLGVSSGRMAGLLVSVLLELGCERALVVHASDGLDEVTLAGPTMVYELDAAGITRFELDPAELGLAPVPYSDLQGGSPAENAAIIEAILAGCGGGRRDIACLNAAMALVVGGRAASAAEGLAMAHRAVDNGAARERLHALRQFTGRARR